VFVEQHAVSGKKVGQALLAISPITSNY